MKNLFARFIQNRHTSLAAVVYGVAAFGCPLLATWWVGHDQQLDATRKTLEALAVFYGFAAAGDAAPAAKPDAPKTP